MSCFSRLRQQSRVCRRWLYDISRETCRIAGKSKKRNGKEKLCGAWFKRLNKFAANYDYNAVPVTGGDITDEHIQKVIDPLLNVADFLQNNSLQQSHSGADVIVDQAEKFVDTLAKIDKQASDSGCRGLCTGLCVGSCTSGCQGCTGCTGGCDTTCAKSCSDGCSTSCGGCSDGCFSGCTHTCGSGCTTGAMTT